MPDLASFANHRAWPPVLVVLSTILIVIWPVAGTVYLRYALLGTLAFLALPRLRAWRDLSAAVPLAVVLLVLTAWLTLGAYRSSYAPYAVSELWGQWYKALAIGLVGALVGLACTEEPHRRNLLSGWIGGLAFLAILAAPADWAFPSLRPLLEFRHGDSAAQFAFNSKTNVSYVINAALALLAAEIVWRARGRGPYLIASDHALYATIAGLLGSMIYFHARNSEICLLATALIGFGFVWHDRASGGPGMQRALRRLAVAFVALAAVATFALAPRLEEFAETVAVAFDTETHRAWIAPTYDFPGAYPWPRLADGTPVDQSLYQRAAWFKEGVVIAVGHPLGLGFGRDVFGWALLTERAVGHAPPSGPGVPQGIPINSHSALLELAIGGGVPGVVLVLTALLLAGRIGYRAYRNAVDPAGLMMVMLVSDFSCRMLVDSNFRDHSLQMLMFAIGAFTAFAQDGPAPDSAIGLTQSPARTPAGRALH